MAPAPSRIVRTVTVFAERPSAAAFDQARARAERLREAGWQVQTTRACFGEASFEEAGSLPSEPLHFVSVGGLSTAEARAQLDAFIEQPNTSFHVDLSDAVSHADVELLFEILDRAPERTFGFSWVVNNPPSVPFFNAARFERPGFAVGLQTPNLAVGCESLEDWLARQEQAWLELTGLFGDEPDFLGLDSSVAPMGADAGSLVNFLRRVAPSLGCTSFAELVTTDIFTRITDHLARKTPRPVGLCGLMLPCLEDAGLAEEYERGDFSIERNLFVSLHSGLGIDTYPIGHDEKPGRVLAILQLLRALSLKHDKPLSCRFVADRSAKIGERTDFQSPYLADVEVRPL